MMLFLIHIIINTMNRFLIISFLFYGTFLFAQQDSTTSLTKYFDDKAWQRNKAIKTDLSEMLLGNLSFILDQEIGEGFGLEAGIGLVNSPLMKPIMTPLSIESLEYNKNLKMGYSFLLEPKRCYFGLYSLYFGVPLNFYLYPGQATYFKVCGVLGKQSVYCNKLILDISAGIGLGFEHSIDGKSYIYNPSFLIPYKMKPHSNITYKLSVKVGYKL